MRVARPLVTAALAVALIASATPCVAQSFGKNKVQYEPLDWAVLETPHVRLHFYAEEESLARRVAALAESTCVAFDTRFRIAPRHQVPILLYSTHHLFQQTNAATGLISESTGGLTELIKGRVLIPHNGSTARLEWVTRHELTHWYMLEKLSRVMREHHRSQSYVPPLWFIEGLAEYCGTTWDADAEGLLRDAVISGEAVPLTRSDAILGTVLMYKEGQAFLLALAERYGDARIFDLMENWYRADDFDTAFRITFGTSLRKVDEEWFSGLKRRFYPSVAFLQLAPEAAQRMTPHGRFNLGPRVFAGGEGADTSFSFCYFAASEGGINLMLSTPRPKGKRHEDRVLRGGRSPQFESFHLFQNRPDASPSGMIALSSKRGGRDALYVVDGRRRRVVRRLEFPRLVAIHDPCLEPGDSAVVFSAQDYGGRSDLYRAHWPRDTVRLERLTDDDYDDLEPDVSPDGRWVLFASDRGERGGRYSLFRLPLAGGSPEAVSHPSVGDDRQPVYSRDGKWIAFRSTRGGTSDLYVRSAEPSSEARRLTRMLGPVSDPDWLPSGRGVLFTGENGITFQTYRLAFDPDTLKAEAETGAPRTPVIAAELDHSTPQRYARRLSLDLVQNAVAVDPGLGGAGGGAQLALSDVLGNEQFEFFLSNDSDRFGGSFWDGFEGGVTYINQSRRFNYGVGLFRLTQVYDADLDVVRRERRVGMLGLASYPFDKFTRIEGSVLVRHASDHLLRSGDFKSVDLVSNFVSLVRDNVGWTYMGPSGGTRAFFSAGFTRDLTYSAGDFATLVAEHRHYATPIPVLVWASRVQAQASLGKDAQRFYLGGRTSLRGYDRRTLSGVQTILLQQEFRFPVVQGLTLALPSPWGFPTIYGVAFADVAWAWEHATDQRLGSVGLGLYVGGGYYPALRWNFAWPTANFRTYSSGPRTQVVLGYNF